MDVDAYLERIAFPGVPATDLPSLAALQRAHLGSVPFENLHVFHRREIRVDTDWSIPKVLSGRGGWCFELNGAFSWLLSEIGFSVDQVPASVLLGEASSDRPDHLTFCDTPHPGRQGDLAQRQDQAPKSGRRSGLPGQFRAMGRGAAQVVRHDAVAGIRCRHARLRGSQLQGLR